MTVCILYNSISPKLETRKQMHFCLCFPGARGRKIAREGREREEEIKKSRIAASRTESGREKSELFLLLVLLLKLTSVGKEGEGGGTEKWVKYLRVL